MRRTGLVFVFLLLVGPVPVVAMDHGSQGHHAPDLSLPSLPLLLVAGLAALAWRPRPTVVAALTLALVGHDHATMAASHGAAPAPICCVLAQSADPPPPAAVETRTEVVAVAQDPAKGFGPADRIRLSLIRGPPVLSLTRL